MRNATAALRGLLTETWRTSLILFRIMIPVSIVIKILKETGLIEIIGASFAPLMELIGLPGAMGLVWVTGMVTNLYGGILAFVAISGDHPLTTAQVTTLTTMMLVAHSLPVELQVARKAGASLPAIFAVRVGGGYLIGTLLYLGYRLTGTLGSPSTISWAATAPADPSLTAWALGELRNYGMIFVIIAVLLIIMALLKKFGVLALMDRLFGPVLSFIGIGREVTTLTIIGMTLGLAYGGALIIREAQTGRIAPRDRFFSMALLSLFHSFIEDTLLMASLGGHFSGLLIVRALFAVGVVWALVRLTGKLSDERFARLLLSRVGSQPSDGR
ncbi:MAG TPA: nucleoside recognition domain-containing protein [bacterium]|nr:nucleoside recognition domain-containing protein [bacterium]